MQLLPDWAPNIHPMIVHFPLVLLIIALFSDAINLFIKKEHWLSNAALILYLLGTIALVIAFLSGKSAADTLDIPGNIISSVNTHADWAEITLWFFSIYTIIRLSIKFFFKSLKKVIIRSIVIIGFLGLYFLFQTGDHGAKLVFGYGLGTGNIINSADNIKKTEDNEQDSESAFKLSKNGSWELAAASDIEMVLSEKFNWINGSIENLSPMYDDAEPALMFHNTKEAMFVYNNKIKSVQLTSEINIDDFKGELELIHHFIDKNNYDFVSLQKGEISLSRKSNGEIETFEKGKFQNNGWLEVRVVADGSHFRAYVNKKMIVHGHGSEPKPGSVGMKFSGEGSISIKMIKVESLKE